MATIIIASNHPSTPRPATAYTLPAALTALRPAAEAIQASVIDKVLTSDGNAVDWDWDLRLPDYTRDYWYEWEQSCLNHLEAVAGWPNDATVALVEQPATAIGYRGDTYHRAERTGLTAFSEALEALWDTRKADVLEAQYRRGDF